MNNYDAIVKESDNSFKLIREKIIKNIIKEGILNKLQYKVFFNYDFDRNNKNNKPNHSLELAASFNKNEEIKKLIHTTIGKKVGFYHSFSRGNILSLEINTVYNEIVFNIKYKGFFKFIKTNKLNINAGSVDTSIASYEEYLDEINLALPYFKKLGILS